MVAMAAPTFADGFHPAGCGNLYLNITRSSTSQSVYQRPLCLYETDYKPNTAHNDQNFTHWYFQWSERFFHVCHTTSQLRCQPFYCRCARYYLGYQIWCWWLSLGKHKQKQHYFTENRWKAYSYLSHSKLQPRLLWRLWQLWLGIQNFLMRFALYKAI